MGERNRAIADWRQWVKWGATPGQSWPVMAFWITVLYAIVASALIDMSTQCTGPSLTECGFLWKLTHLELNALGDFLAGLFAPLAFLWLAVAVAVQSQELAAQREELRLTREEFKLSRGVAESVRNETAAQAATARETAAFIQAQTAIMESKHAEERFFAVLDTLETHLESLDLVSPKPVTVVIHATGARSFLWIRVDDTGWQFANNELGLTEIDAVLRQADLVAAPDTMIWLFAFEQLLEELLTLTQKAGSRANLKANELKLPRLRKELALVLRHVAHEPQS